MYMPVTSPHPTLAGDAEGNERGLMIKKEGQEGGGANIPRGFPKDLVFPQKVF
jgi:hypothetical protein